MPKLAPQFDFAAELALTDGRPGGRVQARCHPMSVSPPSGPPPDRRDETAREKGALTGPGAAAEVGGRHHRGHPASNGGRSHGVGAPPGRRHLTPYRRNRKAREQDWRCADCKALLPAMFHVDHRVPLCEGGSNDWDNLAAICPTCHAAKSAVELERSWDRRRERSLRVSKYFDPASSYRAKPPRLDGLPPWLADRWRPPPGRASSCTMSWP
jgi:HNH endonuclease